jgi:hypothetical protein
MGNWPWFRQRQVYERILSKTCQKPTFIKRCGFRRGWNILFVPASITFRGTETSKSHHNSKQERTANDIKGIKD